MKQRVVIAIAMISNPELLIADEPTTALDVTIQAQIMELMKKLQVEDGKTIILITHNMGLVAEMADEVCVMYMGRGLCSGRCRFWIWRKERNWRPFRASPPTRRT